jgi:general secretion pathway protein J
MNREVPQCAAGARQSGFTLIELLVSLTILGVILGLLGAALRTISHNWDANTRRIDRLDMTSRALDILQRDASGLQRVVVASGESPHLLFTGTRDTLSFVVLEPAYPSEAGPYFVRYSVAANGAISELVRARAPYLRDMREFPGATPANRVPLLQGPFLYRFAYAQKSPGAVHWLDAWPFQMRLPDLIRLQVVDSRQGAPIAPAMVVAIRTDAELGCLSDKAKLCSPRTNGELSVRQGISSSPYRLEGSGP